MLEVINISNLSEISTPKLIVEEYIPNSFVKITNSPFSYQLIEFESNELKEFISLLPVNDREIYKNIDPNDGYIDFSTIDVNLIEDAMYDGFLDRLIFSKEYLTYLKNKNDLDTIQICVIGIEYSHKMPNLIKNKVFVPNSNVLIDHKFIMPDIINYSKIENPKYYVLDINNPNNEYECILECNIPYDIYKLLRFSYINYLYDINKHEYLFGANFDSKSFDEQCMELATNGILNPYLFQINYGIPYLTKENNNNLFIFSKYVGLPSIPALIAIPKILKDVSGESEDYRNMIKGLFNELCAPYIKL